MSSHTIPSTKTSMALAVEQLMRELRGMPADEQITWENTIRKRLYDRQRQGTEPIYMACLRVELVPAEKVQANDYNPNKVANPEMKLLAHSIEEDGLTMAIVAYYDADIDRYIVVDGFHRFTVLVHHHKCRWIPLVVIEKDIKDRMASTIRHNRARGVHKVDLMGEIVAKLIKLGWDDEQIAQHLGMEFEEVLRLKQTTGLAELFRERDFSRSWE